MWLSYTPKFLLQFQSLRAKLTIWVTGWYISVSSVWDSSNPRGEGSKPWGEGCSCWMGDKPNPRMSSILLSPSKNVHISSSLQKKFWTCGLFISMTFIWCMHEDTRCISQNRPIFANFARGGKNPPPFFKSIQAIGGLWEDKQSESLTISRGLLFVRQQLDVRVISLTSVPFLYVVHFLKNFFHRSLFT